MKKLALLLLLALFSSGAYATHLMGGEITAKKLATGKYRITLSYYRDTIGIPLALSETVDIYAASGVGGGSYGLLYSNVLLKFDSVQSQALVPSFPYGVETGIYTSDTVNLPTGGVFRIISNTCCRNGAILNAANPLSEDLVLYTDITTTGGNSTPEFLAMPIAHFALGTTTTYNPLPFDPDLDSIAWDYNTPMGTYTISGGPSMLPVGGFIPLQSTSAFSMNPVTGEVTWTPTVTGNFIESFKVMEYKAGVHSGTIIRDMQYVVVPADTTNPPPNFAMVSSYMVNTQQQYNYIYYTPGQQVFFQIKATGGGSASTVSMHSYGETYQMATPSVFVVSGSGNSVTGTFKWTPDLSLNRDVIVIFRAGNGQFTKDFTLVLKKNPVPSGVKTAGNNNIASFQVYPNPAKSELSVSIDVTAATGGKILIYNTIGQVVTTVYDGLLHKGTMRLTAPIDLPSGNYFVVLKDAGGTVATKGVVVQ